MFRRGFTVIELMVVIVMLGVLAAISVVSYRQVVNNGHDTAVQADVVNVGSEVLTIRSLAYYPNKIQFGNNEGQIQVDVAKESYDLNWQPVVNQPRVNLGYCETVDGVAVFAKSASGKIFAYSSKSKRVEEVSEGVDVVGLFCSGKDLDFIYFDGNWKV